MESFPDPGEGDDLEISEPGSAGHRSGRRDRSRSWERGGPEERGLIIWLKADRDTSSQENGTRIPEPFPATPLNGKGSLEELEEVLTFRNPFYEEAAEASLDTSLLDVEAVVETSPFSIIRERSGKTLKWEEIHSESSSGSPPGGNRTERPWASSLTAVLQGWTFPMKIFRESSTEEGPARERERVRERRRTGRRSFQGSSREKQPERPFLSWSGMRMPIRVLTTKSGKSSGPAMPITPIRQSMA